MNGPEQSQARRGQRDYAELSKLIAVVRRPQTQELRALATSLRMIERSASHGLLAANAKDRAAVVPGSKSAVSPGVGDDAAGRSKRHPLPQRTIGRYLESAALMVRVFSIDRRTEM